MTVARSVSDVLDVGWPAGIAPPAPSDPGVNLSAHRAPIIRLVLQPFGT